MWLTILGAIIAGASALFGIWSANDVDTRNAIIASSLTTVGVAIGLFAAWQAEKTSADEARLQKERHDKIVKDLEAQEAEALKRERTAISHFRALQTSVQLTNLEIVWHIPKSPESLSDAIFLASSIFESYSVRDDEYSRALSLNELSEVRASFAIDDAVGPILAALADGSLDTHKFYTGDVAEVADYYRNLPDDFDPNFAPSVDRSTEMDPALLLPLNVSFSGVLSVGRKIDDPRPQEFKDPSEPYARIINDLLAARSFGFSATATDPGNDGLELRFTYDRKSLDQSARLSPGQSMTIAWPDEFNFLIVTSGLKQIPDYFPMIKDRLKPSALFQEAFSVLRLIPNGLDEAAVEFDVQRGEAGVLRTDISTYYDDYNEDLLQYTSFRARRRLGS